MANRIHWAFDGTICYRVTPSTSTKEVLSYNGLPIQGKYLLDGDLTHSSSQPFDEKTFLLLFSSVITLSKVGLRFILGVPSRGIDILVSTDSTDGFDGTWTTLSTGTAYPTSYVYQEWDGWTPTDAKWLKVQRTSPYTNEGIESLCNVFVFGEYKDPLFEFWDSAGSAEITAEYPLSLSDAPNDMNYSDYVAFKVKNLDTVTHKYTLYVQPTKFVDTRYRTVDDDVIAQNFFLSKDSGVTKTMSLTTADVSASSLSEEIRIYGDVLKSTNPGDGRHYFWVNAIEVIPLTDDTFGAGTQQDIKSGGDGAKLYEWNVINSANADSIDVNVTNAGMLTINLATVTSQVWYNTFTGPFVFQQIQGDFDIEIYVSSYTGNTNYNQIGLMARCLNLEPSYGTPHEAWIKIALRYNGSWKTVTESDSNTATNRDESSTAYPYLRIVRKGYDFFVYGKVNPGDVWTQFRDPSDTSFLYWRRPDWFPLIQVGIVASSENTGGALVGQVDYIRTTV